MSSSFPLNFGLCLSLLAGATSLAFAQDEDMPAAKPAAAAPAPASPPTPTPPAPTPAGEAPKAAPAATAGKKGKAAKGEEAPPPPPAESRELPDCQTYLATPLDGAVIELDKKFYYVSPKLPGDKSAGTSYLVETDLEAGKSKRLAGFRGGQTSALLQHGKIAEALSILDFSSGKPDCGEGKAAALAIKWADQKVLPSFPVGTYGFVEGDIVSHLADLETGLIQDIDLGSRQRRTLESVPAGSRPLYIKATPPIAMYTYHPKTRELSKYFNNKKPAESSMRLKEGMRLLQQGDQFGVLQSKDEGKTLQITQIKGWSGSEMHNYDIKLPNGVLASSVALRISFKGSQVLVFGKDEAARRSLRQVFYYSGKDLKQTFKAPEGSYFSTAQFGREHGTILLVSDIASNVVKEFWYTESANDIRKIDAVKEKKPIAAPKAP
jgi:hypothetical protein